MLFGEASSWLHRREGWYAIPHVVGAPYIFSKMPLREEGFVIFATYLASKVRVDLSLIGALETL